MHGTVNINLIFTVIKYITTEVIRYESVVFKFMDAVKVITHFGYTVGQKKEFSLHAGRTQALINCILKYLRILTNKNLCKLLNKKFPFKKFCISNLNIYRRRYDIKYKLRPQMNKVACSKPDDW